MTKITNFKDIYTKHKDLFDKWFSDPEFVKEIAKKVIIQSFTTRKYCKSYNICEDDNYQNEDSRVPTNDELDNFFQTVYHAGTTYQFFKYATCTILPLQFYSTFHYMFDIFKKGIFVSIQNETIKIFLPFSNASYRNDWGDQLRSGGGGGGAQTVVELEEKNHWNGRHIPTKYHTKIHKDPKKWYANYYMFRNTAYANGDLKDLDDEGDKSVVNFLELLTELCYQRVVADVCFFISPRDFPILKKDRYHPYDRLYKHRALPYLGDMYKFQDIPIFSQSTTSEYADELLPNDDDIVGMLCDEKREIYRTNWKNKTPQAVFRGSATGPPEFNQRIQLYDLAKQHKNIMDVELVGLNDKIKVDDKGYVVKLDARKFPKMNKEYKEKKSLSPKEQSSYKYVIHVQGHVAAFRLTRELAYGSLILKVDSPWNIWYSHLLIGWKVGDNSESGRTLRDTAHYLIIDKDLGNLVSTLKWCMNGARNDEICEQIAKRGLEFYRSHFQNEEYMLDYMHEKLHNYSVAQQTARQVALQTAQTEGEIYGNGLVVIINNDGGDGDSCKKDLSNWLDNHDINYKYIGGDSGDSGNIGNKINKIVKENHTVYDYFIFYDEMGWYYTTNIVDTTNDADRLTYYKTYPKIPIYAGKIISINKYDFYNINGFLNNFTPGENDTLFLRLHENKIKINAPDHGFVDASYFLKNKDYQEPDWHNNGITMA